MRISDWSSDVCSSDLQPLHAAFGRRIGIGGKPEPVRHQRHLALGKQQPRFDAVEIACSRCHRFDIRREHPQKIERLRSEEHTSELQSLMRISYAVFCLKKKNLKNNSTYAIHQKQ